MSIWWHIFRIYLLLSSQLVLSSGNEDDVTTDEAGSEEDNSNSTVTEPETVTNAECEFNGNCCLQYTWPGNELRDVPEPPIVCDDLPSRSRPNNQVACLGPLIYSNSEDGIRPNPEEVVKYCAEHELNCFCTTNNECLKLSYVQTKSKKIINETRFCGTLTDIMSHEVMTSGCYREEIPGTASIREVCACEHMPGGYCNGSTSKVISFATIFTILVIKKFVS